MAYFKGFPDSVDYELNSMELGDEADIQDLASNFDAVACSDIAITTIAITATIVAVVGCSFGSDIANTVRDAMASIDSAARDMAEVVYISDLEEDYFGQN